MLPRTTRFLPSTPPLRPSLAARATPPSLRSLCLAGALVLSGVPSSLSAASVHPLEPLTAEEIVAATDVLRQQGQVPTNCFFPFIGLREPDKAEVLAWKPGQPTRREAAVVISDWERNLTREAVVDVANRRVVYLRTVANATAPMADPEFMLPATLLNQDPTFLAALKRRGLSTNDCITVALTAGVAPVRPASSGRLFRTQTYHRGPNGFSWKPVEGLSAILDGSQRKVLRVVDTGVRPASSFPIGLPDTATVQRERPLKPLVVSQPEGPGFRVDGHQVSWDRWRFRYSLDSRDGLVLHQVGWEESPGNIRPVLYRAAVAEMLVPYADPEETWHWRAYFDAGDFGLGKNAVPLKPGIATPAYATLLHEPMTDQAGGFTITTNAVDLYERDAGILWTHHDGATGTSGARARELVIGSMSTLGNYDYRFQWSFRQDGSLEFHVYLNGFMQLKGTAANGCDACRALAAGATTASGQGEHRHGVLVADHLLAPHHQHFFSLRLDFDVDGPANAVEEFNLATDRPGKRNPVGNAFSLKQTVFQREREAARNEDPTTHRMWAVFNPNRLSSLGHPAAYVLESGMNTVPFLSPKSPARRAAGFMNHHFWVTRHRDAERHPAGEYSANPGKTDTLPAWVSNNEPINNQDVVVWYTLGLTHVARPEEMPVMSAGHTSLRLSPKGFFESNPAIPLNKTP